MPKCLISFGANIGDPAETIHRAVELLQARLTRARLPLTVSRFYRTPPVGGPEGQPPFINAVASAEVDGSAWDAWQAIREVEELLGRRRLERWEARRIDLDILLFEDARIWTPQFKVPHPRMCMRRFILEPAAEVAADWIDPVSGWSIEQLAERLRGRAASLTVVGSESGPVRDCVEQAAEIGRAAWIRPAVIAARSDCVTTSNRSGERRIGWLSWNEIEGRPSSANGLLRLDPPSNLMIALADPVTVQGAAWEDFHRALSRRLHLHDSQERENVWPFEGPRYLLASDDEKWAVHELVAACEAMDCPVEPIRT